jgi:hypothetical protein
MSVGHRRDAWLLVGLLAFYLVLAAVLPAADDEVYYWAWARPLQFSYYDHPPLTAYMIRLSTDIFGDSIFGFRVPACLATVFVAMVIAHLSRPRSLLPGVLLTPLFTLGAVLITPDTPLLCCWAAYVWWLVEVHRRLTPLAEEGGPASGEASLPWWLWLVGGVILGGGVLGKYTMALAVPSGFISFCLVWRHWKRWLPGYIAHGVVSFLVASPILIHNIQHDFVPLLFQWRHSMGDSRPGLKPFGEFVGVQLLLFGTLPFFLYPWVLRNFRTLCENPRLRACACLYALPMTFFLYKATQAPLQGNWALVMFVSFWPLAAVWYESVRQSKIWRELVQWSFAIPAVCVLVLAVHVVIPLPFIPIEGDRVTRQYALNETTHQIAETIRQRGEELPVFTPTYQMTAWMRFQSVDGRQIDQISRPSHFTQRPEHLSDVNRAYVVAEFPLPAQFAPGFGEPELVGDFPVKVRGADVRDFKLYLYSKSIAAKPPRQNVSLVSYEEPLESESYGSKQPILDPIEESPALTLQLKIYEVPDECLEELEISSADRGSIMLPANRFEAKLQDLQAAMRVKILGESALALEPEKPARYFSGGEFTVPVPGNDKPETREFGTEVIATATPAEDGRFKLVFYASVSEQDMNNAITVNDTLAPGISRRRFQSTFMLAPNDPKIAVVLQTGEKWTLIRYELETRLKPASTTD